MRTGLTKEYKQEKLVKIMDELEILFQENNFHNWFGNIDPIQAFHEHINLCQGCLQKPKLVKIDKKFQVVCQCGFKGQATKKDFQAIFIWNKSPKSIVPYYGDLPIFNYSAILEKQEIKERLDLIKKYLELKKNEAGLRRDLGYTKTNIKFINRLSAFHCWCVYAQTLLKEY